MAVPHSCDNKAPSWGLAGWLGLSLAIKHREIENIGKSSNKEDGVKTKYKVNKKINENYNSEIGNIGK